MFLLFGDEIFKRKSRYRKLYCIRNCFKITQVSLDKRRSKFHCNLLKSIFFHRNIPLCKSCWIPVKPLVVNITNKETHLSALKTYEVECASSGSRPEAVITWWKGNHQVKHMARNVSRTFLNLYQPRFVSTFVRQVHVSLDSEFFVVCRQSEHHEKRVELCTHHGGRWKISDLPGGESGCT